MENYFQAEAFNLDKVLDEFEQNEGQEQGVLLKGVAVVTVSSRLVWPGQGGHTRSTLLGNANKKQGGALGLVDCDWSSQRKGQAVATKDETDTPTFTDAKWTQILAPPSHLVSLNPALAHPDFSPRETPLNFKPLPQIGSERGDQHQQQGPEDSTTEPLKDLHSPLPPQPNIGKLVSGNGHPLPGGDPQSDPLPLPGLENGCSPEVNGCPEEPIGTDDGYNASHSEKGGGLEENESFFKDTHFSLEDQGNNELGATGSTEEHQHNRIIGSPKEEHNLEVPVPPSNLPDLCEDANGYHETIANGDATGLKDPQDNQIEGHDGNVPPHQPLLCEKADVDTSEEGSSFPVELVPNGVTMGTLVVSCRGDRSIHGPPSKEDSVTEEKEMEESKQECLEVTPPGIRVPGSKPCSTTRLQPVSIPYGGARPKQPINLKLQIPRPLSGQVQVESAKNKNLELPGQVGVAMAMEESGGNSESGSRSPHMSPAQHLPHESPDNDIQAGHMGTLSKKPFSSLGEVAPVWVPDSQAPLCMKCEVKFTFTKRRHHCRACGKVFCAACCSLKCRLVYMERKEARVCIPCHATLTNTQSLENTAGGSSLCPNPNNPAEYCSTIPPLQQAQASGALSSPPPTVMVPVGVLKHPGAEGILPREQRRVWFADGILPNGDPADSSKDPTGGCVSSTVSQNSGKPSTASPELPPEVASGGPNPGAGAPTGSSVGSSINLIPEDGLPPILISTGVKGDYAVEERPSEILMMQQLEEGGPEPFVFVLNANLLAMVKLVNYVNRKCWCVTTKGMHAVGQAEVVVLLQCLPDEKTIPKDIFTHFVQLYQEALSGNVVSNLGHSFFTQSFLGSKEHGGFLYINPTFQSLQDLLLPNPPYLFGVLVQKWETPWAKVFPIRLMLRLGAEYRFYPCPLFSVRFRKPLFGETGHTIMNLLADFRNYQYTLPVVTGLVIDLEVRKTCIRIPSNRYNELMKAMNKSNEHVLAMGACFNERADSHLVCVQNDDGNYQTQAISIHNQPRKVTGACFFVFSGALKASSGYLAKTSIVEDGVMVQITAETMESLRQALREMKDFTVTCGKADQEENQEHVHIQWMEDDCNFNKGVISPIDGRSMESITSIKIFHGSEYKANGKVIRWTEVFFLQSDDQPNGLSDPADHSRLTENVARAFCVALCPHLKLLKEDGMAKLGLRVTLDADQVGYLAGSNGQALPSQYMNDLDSALVPVIHGGACQLSEGPVVMELFFYILENIS